MTWGESASSDEDALVAGWTGHCEGLGLSFEDDISNVARSIFRQLVGIAAESDLSEMAGTIADTAIGFSNCPSITMATRACWGIRQSIIGYLRDRDIDETLSDDVYQICLEAATEHFVAELEYVGKYDSLTALRNRRVFDEEISDAVTRSMDTGEQVTLAIVDLDDLKKINDGEGYDAGTGAIIELARLLMEKTKESDTAYRWGGDEFAVIFKRTSGEVAVAALKRASNEANAPKFTFGVASFPDEAENVNDLFVTAEERLKAEKAKKKVGRL